jgi:hypothetical protein
MRRTSHSSRRGSRRGTRTRKWESSDGEPARGPVGRAPGGTLRHHPPPRGDNPARTSAHKRARPVMPHNFSKRSPTVAPARSWRTRRPSSRRPPGLRSPESSPLSGGNIRPAKTPVKSSVEAPSAKRNRRAADRLRRSRTSVAACQLPKMDVAGVVNLTRVDA